MQKYFPNILFRWCGGRRATSFTYHAVYSKCLQLQSQSCQQVLQRPGLKVFVWDVSKSSRTVVLVGLELWIPGV